MRILGKLKANKLVIQLLKFGGVGVINTLVDFAVMWILLKIYGTTLQAAHAASGSALLQWIAAYAYVIAQTISFLCGATCSYFLNKYWTFGAKEQKSKTAILRMYIVSAAALCLTNLGLIFLIQGCGMRHEMLAKLIVTPVVMLFNFLGSKLWVFREKRV